MKRYLILDDGSVFEGEGFGAKRTSFGEVVFTTGMTGYQEAVTDQSYANQILVFTNPLIGNYGVNLDDFESLEPNCQGVVCREVARVSTNWRKQESFPEFLEEMNIPGISGVDTRALTKLLRSHGTMKGIHAENVSTLTVDGNQVPEDKVTVNYQPIPGNKIEKFYLNESKGNALEDHLTVKDDKGLSIYSEIDY